MADETKIIRLIIDSSRAVDGSAAATRALAKLEQQGAAVESTLMRMEKGLGRLGGFMKAQLALMVAELAARLVQLGKNAFDAASGMDELAEQVGVTSRFFQASQFEAAQNGVKLEQLEAGYSKFSQKMGEAAEGSKEMIEALERLGVKNLDVAGKLRPTEDILVDVARAITAIDDPARRAAAAVDFFGKAGTRMLPMLSSIAAGTDVMAARMEAAGAYIEDGTVKRLDAIGDAAARSGLRWRAFTANTIAATVDWYERNSALIGIMTGGLSLLIEAFIRSPQAVTGAIGNAYDSAMTAIGNGIAAAQQGFDDLVRAGTVAQAMFLAAFDGLGLKLGEIFRDAMNAAIEAVETGLNAITRNAGSWFSKDRAPINLGRLQGNTTAAAGSYGVVPPEASYGDYSSAQVQGAGIAALAKLPPARNYRADLDERRAIEAHQQFWAMDTAGTGPTPTVTTGVGLSGIKGAGQDVQDRITKLQRDTARDVEAADAYAVASERGARAVADLETHYKALKAAQDAYGKTTEQNAGQVAEMTRELEEQYKAIERRNNLKEFNLGTAEMERANALLEAENNLINANTEDRARELALVRLKQDVESKGLDETNEKDRRAIERRAEAITQNERLKAQGEELRKANELWTEPLKSALQSIQGTAADMFDSMLEKGTFSFEEIGKVGQRIVRRMVAEFAALAVIRPVLGSVVGGLASIGLVSPATASQLGYASGSSPGLLSFLTSGSTSAGPMGAGSGSSTYSYVTSGSPGNASTVYGPTSDASTVYGPTSNASAVYGATTNASAIYGPTSGASTIYGPTSNASAVHGATTNASEVYGPTSISSTVYGATTNAPAVYGPTSISSAVYGATTNASAVYGPTSSATAIYGPTSNVLAAYGRTTNTPAIFGPTSNASTVYRPASNASMVNGPTSNASTNYAGDINSEIATWIAYGPTAASTKVATENALAVEDLTTRYQGLKVAQDAYGTTAYKTTAQVDGLTQKLEDQVRAIVDGVSAYSPPGGVLAANNNSATSSASAIYGPASNASTVYGPMSNASTLYGPTGNASAVYGPTTNASTVYGATSNASTNYAGDINSEIASWIAYGPTAASTKVAIENARAVEDLTARYQGLKVAQDAYGSTAYKTTAQVDGLTQKLGDQFKTIADGVSAYSPSGGGLAANSNSASYNTSSTYAGDINNEIANWISYGSSPSSGIGAAGAVAQSTAVTTANARAVEDLATQYKGLKATQDSYGNTADKNKSQVDSLTTELEDQFKALSSVTSAYDRAGSAAHTINNYSTSTNYNASNYAGDINNEIANWSSYGNSSTSMPTSTSTTYAGGGYYNYDATGSAIYSGGTFSAPSAGSMSAYRSPGSGGFSMPGFGGGGSGMGSFELPSWLGGGSIAELMASTPFASAAPAGGFASIEALMASGQAGPSAGWAAGGLGGAVQGLSVGSMLGAGVGIGMGAYSLARSKNTAQTIGGIGQMIGGGMMLIPGMQIPGMVVSALSAILPSLFGGEEYKWAPLSGAEARFNPGAGGYSMAETQQLGGRSIGGQYGSVATTIDGLFKATGGKLNPALATGGAIWQNQREGTTSTYAIHPWLGSVQLSEGSGDQSGAVDRMIAKMFYMTATTAGALTGVSPTLTKALGNKEPTGTAAVNSLLDLVKAYDDLGKVTGTAEAALKAINDNFDKLTTSATEYGLALAPIKAEQDKQTKRYAQDFIDKMLDPLAVQLRTLDDEREAALASARYIRDNVKDVYVDLDRITTYYAKKESDAKVAAWGTAIDSIEAAIRRLTTGDLSNTSPSTGLTGLRASYGATLAQARAGDSAAIGRLATEGTDYAAAGRQYFASSAEYQALVEQIRKDLAEVQGAIQSPSASAPLSAKDPALQTMLAGNEQLRQIVSDQSAQIASLSTMVDRLTAQLQRVAVVGR